MMLIISEHEYQLLQKNRSSLLLYALWVLREKDRMRGTNQGSYLYLPPAPRFALPNPLPVGEGVNVTALL